MSSHTAAQPCSARSGWRRRASLNHDTADPRSPRATATTPSQRTGRADSGASAAALRNACSAGPSAPERREAAPCVIQAAGPPAPAAAAAARATAAPQITDARRARLMRGSAQRLRVRRNLVLAQALRVPAGAARPLHQFLSGPGIIREPGDPRGDADRPRCKQAGHDEPVRRRGRTDPLRDHHRALDRRFRQDNRKLVDVEPAHDIDLADAPRHDLRELLEHPFPLPRSRVVDQPPVVVDVKDDQREEPAVAPRPLDLPEEDLAEQARREQPGEIVDARRLLQLPAELVQFLLVRRDLLREQPLILLDRLFHAHGAPPITPASWSGTSSTDWDPTTSPPARRRPWRGRTGSAPDAPSTAAPASPPRARPR